MKGVNIGTIFTEFMNQLSAAYYNLNKNMIRIFFDKNTVRIEIARGSELG